MHTIVKLDKRNVDNNTHLVKLCVIDLNCTFDINVSKYNEVIYLNDSKFKMNYKIELPKEYIMWNIFELFNMDIEPLSSFTYVKNKQNQLFTSVVRPLYNPLILYKDLNVYKKYNEILDELNCDNKDFYKNKFNELLPKFTNNFNTIDSILTNDEIFGYNTPQVKKLINLIKNKIMGIDERFIIIYNILNNINSI